MAVFNDNDKPLISPISDNKPNRLNHENCIIEPYLVFFIFSNLSNGKATGHDGFPNHLLP